MVNMLHFAPVNLLTFVLCASPAWSFEHEDTVGVYEQGKEFCYSEPGCGPRSWDGLCQTGTHQSPISLSYGPILPGGTQLHQSTYRANNFRMRNNGHTVQVELSNQLDSNNSSKPIGLSRYRIDGYDPIEYRLDSAHFHWGAEDNVGSEHEFDGQRFSMELHMVHFRSNYSSTTAALKSTDSNAIAVIGIMLNVTNSSHGNQYLAPLIQNLAKVNQPSQQWTTVSTAIDFTQFLPSAADQNYMYTYKGSLTTPTCDEKVNWYVFPRPVQISHSDVQQFRTLMDDNGHSLEENHRPIQPKNDRTVFLIPIASI